MQYFPMTAQVEPAATMVGGDVIMIEILIYWAASAALIAAMDFYARKRLGKGIAGYMALRVPRFIAAVVVSLTSIAIVLYTTRFDIPQQVVSYLGIPYLAMWFYFVVNVFRRIRAERDS